MTSTISPNSTTQPTSPSIPLATEHEFLKLKEKLINIIQNPQYLSYHLHVTFEINFQHLLSNPLLFNHNNNDNTNDITTNNNKHILQSKIYNLIKHLESHFGLNNFTIISLPLEHNTSYIQYLTTCKFNTTPLNKGNNNDTTTIVDVNNYEVFQYYNTLYELQQLQLINAIGFKIEGVVFPSKKPLFIQKLESNPNLTLSQLQSISNNTTNDFCYYETHRKVATIDGLKLQSNELISYSYKNQCFMSAFRDYDITKLPQNLQKYEVCIYETWLKDIEKDWKIANITNGDFVIEYNDNNNINNDEDDSSLDEANLNMYFNQLFIKTLETIQVENA